MFAKQLKTSPFNSVSRLAVYICTQYLLSLLSETRSFDWPNIINVFDHQSWFCLCSSLRCHVVHENVGDRAYREPSVFGHYIGVMFSISNAYIQTV